VGLTPSAIVFLIAAAGCGAISTLLTFQEIEEVNRKLPSEEQIEHVWKYPGKMRRVRSTYKRFYPDGTTDRWRRTFAWAGFVFIALTAVAAGFLR
jgi:hypothetical protein